MYSVRRRLLFALVLGFAVLVIGSGVVVSHVLSARALEDYDATLLAKAQAVAALTEQEDGEIEFDYKPGMLPEFEGADHPAYFQFWELDGVSRRRSVGLGEDLPPDAMPAPGHRIRDVTLPDGRAGRAVSLHYEPRGPGDEDEEEDEEDPAPAAAAMSGGLAKPAPAPPAPVSIVLVVARSRERLDGTLATMRWAVFGGGALVILLGLLLVWRAVALGFAPLGQIANQVEGLDAESLDARIALDPKPSELAPIVEQLNALLHRLHESFDRERRFAGNVAHELRTPLAELRSLAAVGARWPDDRDAIVRFFDDVDEVAGRMERVIADLSLLARCHAGVERALCVPTELRELADKTWASLAPRAREREVTGRFDMPGGLVIDTDPGKFSILLANVLGNAVSYAHRNTEITCTGWIRDGRFHLEVSNTADRLAEDDLRHLTEPFWRKDTARASSGHAGLGLSLVAALTELLEMQMRFEQGKDGRFRVHLEGPERHPGPYRPEPTARDAREAQLPIRSDRRLWGSNVSPRETNS